LLDFHGGELILLGFLTRMLKQVEETPRILLEDAVEDAVSFHRLNGD
jgi:hypothetical protein